MRRPSGAHVQGAPFGSICLLLQWAQNLLSRRDSSWMHTRPVHAYVLPRQHQRTLQRQRLLLLPLPKITDRRRDYTTSSSHVDRSIDLIVVELMNKFFWLPVYCENIWERCLFFIQYILQRWRLEWYKLNCELYQKDFLAWLLDTIWKGLKKKSSIEAKKEW
jgi:hypothetical protein